MAADRAKWIETREKCLELHALGLSRLEIAHRLGKSKNAIVGVLYRLGIRDEPISRVARVRKRANVRVKARKQVKKPEVTAAFHFDATQEYHSIKRNEKWDIENPSPNPQGVLTKDRTGRLHANDKLTDSCCRFGIGDPSTPEFHFCGRESVPGVAYCEAHHRRVWAPVPQSRKPTKLPSRLEIKILEPAT